MFSAGDYDAPPDILVGWGKETPLPHSLPPSASRLRDYMLRTPCLKILATPLLEGHFLFT